MVEASADPQPQVKERGAARRNTAFAARRGIPGNHWNGGFRPVAPLWQKRTWLMAVVVLSSYAVKRGSK
jgi:hypothetical protein